LRRRAIGIGILIVMLVLPIVAQATAFALTLHYGEIYGTYIEAKIGWRIEGFVSTDGIVEFFICDASNYDKWINNQTAILYEHSEQTTSSIFNFSIPYDAEWFVIIANSNSQEITLDGEINYIDQEGSVKTQVTDFTRSLFASPLVLGFIVIALFVFILGIWCARRKEAQPAVRYEKILPYPG
jgi:hypothetical protein